jgi:hypothetical protein
MNRIDPLRAAVWCGLIVWAVAFYALAAVGVAYVAGWLV